MGKIFLVRHGQDEANFKKILNGISDTELTEYGREQSREVGKKLMDYDIGAIYSSPLIRAYHTAKIIADQLAINDVAVDEQLMERSFGILTGKPVSDILKYTNNVIPADGVDYFLDVEGAEGFADLFIRAQTALEHYRSMEAEENILLVTHGDIGKMLRAAALNISWEKGLAMAEIKNAEIVDLSGNIKLVKCQNKIHELEQGW